MITRLQVNRYCVTLKTIVGRLSRRRRRFANCAMTAPIVVGISARWTGKLKRIANDAPVPSTKKIFEPSGNWYMPPSPTAAAAASSAATVPAGPSSATVGVVPPGGAAAGSRQHHAAAANAATKTAASKERLATEAPVKNPFGACLTPVAGSLHRARRHRLRSRIIDNEEPSPRGSARCGESLDLREFGVGAAIAGKSSADLHVVCRGRAAFCGGISALTPRPADRLAGAPSVRPRPPSQIGRA